MKMSYWRFAAMIVTSTVVMFALMYVHTHTWHDAYFSETRAWMAVLMGATMTIVMLGFMWAMYANRTVNQAIVAAAALALVASIWLIRSQVTIDDTNYMTAMVPHHSIAILTSTRAHIEDPRVRKLADEITLAQRKEIAEMNYLIRELRRQGTSQRSLPRAVAPTMAAAAAARTADLSTTDLEPITAPEVTRILGAAPTCRFSYASGEAPVAVATVQAGPGGRGLIKLHGRLVEMTPRYASDPGQGFELSGDDVTVTATPHGPATDIQPREADAIFAVGPELEVGYAGFYACDAF